MTKLNFKISNKMRLWLRMLLFLAALGIAPTKANQDSTPVIRTDAPSDQIDCLVSLTRMTTQVQFVLLSSFIQLAPETESVEKICKIKRANLKSQYLRYYSDLLLDCGDPFPTGVTGKFVSLAEMDRDQISISLQRFPSSSNRVAGLSLGFNAARGYFGSVLLEPKIDGPFRQIQTPVKLDEQEAQGLLLISCSLSSPKSVKPF